MKRLAPYGWSVVRFSLGAVFLYAGVLKILDPARFALSIASYRILPHTAAYVAAAVLPWVEAICGLLLVTGKRTRTASFLVLVLTSVFAVALLSAAIRGLHIDCGCFRDEGTTPLGVALLRDCLLLAAALLLFRRAGRAQEGVQPCARR